MDISNYLPKDTGAFAIIGIVFALLECFFGFKLKRLWSTLIGFFIGLCLGGIIGFMLFSADERVLLFALICAIVLGLICGAVAFTFYQIGMFIYMSITTLTSVYSLTNGLINVPDANVTINLLGYGEKSINIIALILGAVIGLIVGILTLKFMRIVTILNTAISKGFVASYLFFNGVMVMNNMLVTIIVAVIIIALGIWFQLATTKSYSRSKRF